MPSLSSHIFRALALSGLIALLATTAQSQVVINEFMADNEDTLLDEDGENSDWIELHNTSGAGVDLAGWRITDDAGGLTPWVFPSVNLPVDGYLVVFASGEDRLGSELHTDFKLSTSGEYLALSPPGGAAPTSEFSPAYPSQLEDVSYGSRASGSFGYLAEPTPGSPNGDDLHPARDVGFDIPRGFYDAPVTVTLTCEEAGAVIRYTTDGSEPSLSNGSTYTSPLSLANTTCLRAVAFLDEMAPSEVSTRTYLFVADVFSQDHVGAIADGFPAEWIEQDGTPWTDYHDGNHPGAWYGYEDAQLSLHTEEELREALLSIPSVSLVMSIDDWFGYNPPDGVFGVYANVSLEGDEWERAGSMEWIDPTTGEGFQINCGLGMQGGSGSTITWASQASMDAKFKREYGEGKLRFPLFEDSNVEEFDRLVFDAGNQNSIHANTGFNVRRHAQCMRDQFMMEVQRAVGCPAAAGRHAHVFINGLYWGLFNVHEVPDENWAANHEGGEPEEYDWVKEGAVWAGNNHPFDHPTTPGSWRTAIEIASNGLGLDDQWLGVSSYEAIAEHIDLANYAEYMLLNFYGGHLDWPNQNWNGTSHARNSEDFSDVSPDAAFVFQSWDAETTLNWHGVTAVNDGWYDRTFVGDTDDIGNIAYMYGRLRGHPEFRMLLADRVQRMIAPGGALYVEPGADTQGTPFDSGQNAPADLYHARSSQIEAAVRLEYARWANYFEGVGSVSPADWEIERRRLLEDYFPVRSGVLIEQLRAATPQMYPTIDAPTLSQHGGQVGVGFQLELSAPVGEVYLTTDGSDPRLVGGAISPSSLLYSGPVSIDGAMVVVKARALAGGEWSALTDAVFTRVLISELMAKNESFAVDEAGEYEDWIELYNGSDSSVDLSGWFLSDDELDLTQWVLPAGSTLAPGDGLLIWADGDETDGPLHASFQLNAAGERLLLSAPLDDGAHLVDTVSFGPQGSDRSHGRMPTTSHTFVSLLDPSPGAQNEPSPGEAVRFVSEGEREFGPLLQASGLPFAGQVVSLLVNGFTPGGAGLLEVGRTIDVDGEFIGERLGAFELPFQADAQGSVILYTLLPRWSSRLKPAQLVPSQTVFYIQAVSRSDSTNGIAVCVQN